MTEPRNHTVTNAEDLLAVVPQVLGFHPQDSVVLMTAGGKQFHARIDLPREPAEAEEVVATLTDVACRNGVRRAVVVVYGDDHQAADELFWWLETSLELQDVEVLGGLRADGRRWFPLTGLAEDGWPGEGHPYDVAAHPITARAVVEGKVTLASRQELADSLVGDDPEAVAAVAAVVDEIRVRDRLADDGRLEQREADPPHPHTVAEGRWLQGRVRRFLADGELLDDADTGRMLVALESVDVRDVAWAEMGHANAAQHVALWRDVVRRCPRDLLAAPAALLAFAAWLAGDGALAWCAVARCKEVRSDYSLAGLLTEALAGGLPPSAWSPLPSSALRLFNRWP